MPLELAGGLYTEATPETLPLGASPLVINCDFILGSNLQRPGKKNQYYFLDLFSEKLTTFAQSISGASAPNEAPWSVPNNVTLNLPGVYGAVTLNAPAGGPAGGTVDHIVQNLGSSATMAASATPGRAGEVALLISESSNNTSSHGAPTPGAWTLLDNPNGASISSMYSIFLSSENLVSETQTLNVGSAWTTVLCLFGSSNGAAISIRQQTTIQSGNFGAGNVTQSFTGNTVAGNGILVVFATGLIFNVVAECASRQSYSDIQSWRRQRNRFSKDVRISWNRPADANTRHIANTEGHEFPFQHPYDSSGRRSASGNQR